MSLLIELSIDFWMAVILPVFLEKNTLEYLEKSLLIATLGIHARGGLQSQMRKISEKYLFLNRVLFFLEPGITTAQNKTDTEKQGKFSYFHHCYLTLYKNRLIHSFVFIAIGSFPIWLF